MICIQITSRSGFACCRYLCKFKTKRFLCKKDIYLRMASVWIAMSLNKSFTAEKRLLVDTQLQTMALNNVWKLKMSYLPVDLHFVCWNIKSSMKYNLLLWSIIMSVKKDGNTFHFMRYYNTYISDIDSIENKSIFNSQHILFSSCIPTKCSGFIHAWIVWV